MIGIRKRQPVIIQPVSRLLSYPTLFLALLLLLSAYPILRLTMSSPQYTLSPFSKTYLSALPPTPEYLTKPLSEQRDIREQAAAALSPLGAAAHPMLSVVDVQADGPRPPVRVFVPLVLDPSAPVVMYVHGGGWVLSSVRTHDTVCRQIAEATKARVISLQYRLSPETPYPGPLDDCYHGYLYALTMRANGGGGVMLVGDSAGGNLVAGLAHRLRDEGGVKPLSMVLIYPALDARCSTQSMKTFDVGFGLSRDAMEYYWRCYLEGEEGCGEKKKGGAAGGVPHSNPIYASPAEDTNFKGLPPAVIGVAQVDVLRDDGVEYAQKLREAGGVVVEFEAKGELHGFIKHTKNPASLPFIQLVTQQGVALAKRGGN
jgi:acetyl esterase